MTDKIKKIREELARLKEETSIGLSEHENGVEQGRMEIINALSIFLDSSQEEPVSEDLEEAAHQCYEPNDKFMEGFKKGAKWQKEQMMKEAVDAKITLLDGISYVNKDVLSQFKQGDKVKVIVIKEGDV